MSAIRFTILGACVSMKNSRQLVPRGGRIIPIKSKEALQYERDALRQIPPAARQQIEGPVRVTMRLFYTWEGPDLDASLLLDILADRYEKKKGKLEKVGDGEFAYAKSERVLVQKGVYKNDRQVRALLLIHGIDKVNPRAEIIVEPMAAQQAPLSFPEDLPHEAG